MAISFRGFEHGLLLQHSLLNLESPGVVRLTDSSHLPISQSSIFRFVLKKNMWHTVSHLIVAKRTRCYVPIKFHAAIVNQNNHVAHDFSVDRRCGGAQVRSDYIRLIRRQSDRYGAKSIARPAHGIGNVGPRPP